MAKVVANNAQTAATEVLAGLVERVTFHNLRREPTDDGKDSESSCLSDRFCKRVGTAVPRNSMHKRTFAKGSKPGMTGLLLGYARVSKADDQTNTALSGVQEVLCGHNPIEDEPRRCDIDHRL